MPKPPINTNVRLFDLVRYMRTELHEAELITDQEYFWLCAEAPMAKGQGSPSPRRLEDYDEIRAKMKRMEEALSFYAGKVRQDGNGYEFDDEPEHMRGETARRALAPDPAED